MKWSVLSLMICMGLFGVGCATFRSGTETMGTDQLIEALSGTSSSLRSSSAVALGGRRLTTLQIESMMPMISNDTSPELMSRIVAAIDAELARRSDAGFSEKVARMWLDKRHSLSNETATLTLVDTSIKWISNREERFDLLIDLFENSPQPLARYEALDRLVDESYLEGNTREAVMKAARSRLGVETHAPTAAYICDISRITDDGDALPLLEMIANDRSGIVYADGKTRRRTLSDGTVSKPRSYSQREVKIAAIAAIDAIRTALSIL